MKKTRSAPIQFRLDLNEYDILELLAEKEGMTPKDYVIALTQRVIGANRDLVSTDYTQEP